MANLTRQLLKLFGDSGSTPNFGKFGSQAAGSPVKTKDIQTIQSLSAWLDGLQDAVNPSNKAPFLEDINSLLYVFCYELCYMLQKGIPEWDSTTTYYTGDLVRDPSGSSAIFGSRTDSNTGNALPSIGSSNSYWNTIYPVNFSDLLGSIAIGQIPDSLITSAKIASLAATKISGLILAAQIQSLDVSQLTGILPLANGGTDVTHKIFSATTYVGNGITSHNVPHSLGIEPDICLVMRQDGLNNQSPVLWAQTLQSGTSRTMAGVSLSDGIVAADATNITLGVNGLVNSNGAGYSLFSFKGQ